MTRAGVMRGATGAGTRGSGYWPTNSNADTFAARGLERLFDGRPASACAQWSFPEHSARRVCGAGGAQWLRKIDTAQSCRGYGFSDIRQGTAGRSFDLVAERQRSYAASAREGWLYFSVVSIAAHADSFRERRTATAPRPETQRTRSGPRTAWLGGAGRTRRTLSSPTFRRADATRGHCAGACPFTEPPAGRRTHRQSRHHLEQRNTGIDPAPHAGAEHRDHCGDSQCRGRVA